MYFLHSIKLKLIIIYSNTIGVLYAFLCGKKIISLSDAYIDYLENYLFSSSGAGYELDYVIPEYGENSFNNWVKSKNYHLKLSKNIDFSVKLNSKSKFKCFLGK